MKRYTLALLITSSVALAGDPDSAKSAKSAKGGKIPVPEKSTPWAWFAGASGGYLLDNESGMVNGHIGVDLPWQVAGFGQALFLEVGWTECGDDFEIARNVRKDDKKSKKDDKKNYRMERVEKGFGTTTTSVSVNTDIEIIPITLNYKLEREIARNLSIYLGAGAGIAIVDVETSGGLNGSDEDVVFFGQVFGGLVYNLTDNFEVFGGVRGIYMDDPDLSVGGMSLGGHALETDLLIEGGGRVNF